MVLHTGLFLQRREEFVQMAAPARRILARAMSPCGCPIKDGLDARTYTRRCLRFGGPHWFEHLEHHTGVDVLNRFANRVPIGFVGFAGSRPLSRISCLAR